MKKIYIRGLKTKAKYNNFEDNKNIDYLRYAFMYSLSNKNSLTSEFEE